MECKGCGKLIGDHSEHIKIVEVKKVWKYWIFGWNHNILATYHPGCYVFWDDTKCR